MGNFLFLLKYEFYDNVSICLDLKTIVHIIGFKHIFFLFKIPYIYWHLVTSVLCILSTSQYPPPLYMYLHRNYRYGPQYIRIILITAYNPFSNSKVSMWSHVSLFYWSQIFFSFAITFNLKCQMIEFRVQW